MVKKPIIIPIEVCQDALTNKTVRKLQVFIWLKLNCSGKIKINPDVEKSIAQSIGVKSHKTVKSSIQYLLEKQLITRSKKSGYYFVKGFESIRRVEGFTKRTGAEFNLKYIKNFKGFLVAAVISQLISVQKRRLWVIERKKTGLQDSYPHTASLLSNC